MRSIELAVGEYYHLFNRGVNKQNIFLDTRDRTRFLFNILYLQSTRSPLDAGTAVSYFLKHSVFNLRPRTESKIIQNRFVELAAFVLMPNHFHLLVLEKEASGISRYMQKILNSYTKYFNIKYEKSGHLFQGPFKAVRVSSNEQLLYLSAYLHRNPRELKQWRGREDRYVWSSYPDLLYQNRWGEFLKSGIIGHQFSDPKEYRRIVEESGAKEFVEDELRFD